METHSTFNKMKRGFALSELLIAKKMVATTELLLVTSMLIIILKKMPNYDIFYFYSISMAKKFKW